ncbi:class I SAM-dependent methyltransferase [Salipaludibacillus sp. CUR1]|uniref:class I SAM-dependent DNA methyltransferase n=1 Tax=Salipaludibacillus sp. CUR1 TaxID=2820003 RepID=UPI001E406D88|nr:class I SAM-dependent methyltransferase [Salipaludibacillus sp. CUR1]MCE7794181.1 class I SAM-dependent methyltransferase [Salipaludibacillus sp. CUR1]
MTLEHFASLYDALMEDAPYESWMTYASRHLKEGGNVVDVACGTGTFTLMMAEHGFNMAGADLSQDMLTVAEDKVRQSSQNIPLYLQDMCELSGFTELDGVTLFCDGINYLNKEEDVKKTFRKIALALKPGGVFLFDAHSPYKMEHIFDNQLYGENEESLSYMWFCEPENEPLSVRHSLTFFMKNKEGTYERLDEEHYQRTFLPREYLNWLKEAGFDHIEITGGFGEEELKDDDDRVFFKAVKK